MATIKPVIRITILSSILAFLLIYFGIKYHWGAHLQLVSVSNQELSIPEKTSEITNTNQNVIIENTEPEFQPELINVKQPFNPLADMSKDQLKTHCYELLSKTIKNTSELPLAVADCVLSNYTESYQEISETTETPAYQQKKRAAQTTCSQQYSTLAEYSVLQKQLLTGICVSSELAR